MKKPGVFFPSLQAVSGILLVLTILAPTAVVGGSYSSTFFIFTSSDPQKRHFGDLAVAYSSPDSITAGNLLGVDVSITYINNNNATFPWIEIYNVSASLRESPKGADLAFDIDSSTVKAAPGQQYTHKFNVRAPQKSGQYILILAWLTHNPQANAYGYRLDDSIINWDIGAKRQLEIGTYGDPPKVAVNALTTAATTTSTPLTTRATQIVTVTTSPSSTEAQQLSLGQNPLLIGAAAGIVLVAVLLVVFMKRRGGPKMEGITTPTVESRRGPSPTPPPPPATGFKHCIHCGAAIPAVVVFCTKCGKKQG